MLIIVHNNLVILYFNIVELKEILGVEYMDRFNGRHFALLIMGVAIVSLKTYPGIFLRNGSRESWIAIVIASLLIFFIYMYIINISEKNSRPNICQVYQTAFGNIIGNIAICIFIATLILTLIECSSVEANSMRENMLVETPNWYFLLFFIIPIIYVIFKDLTAIVMVTSIGIVLIILAGTNLAILTTRYKDYHLLLPVFHDGNYVGFFICIIKMLALYGCASIVLPYIHVIGDSKKGMIRGTLLGLVMVIQMQIVSVTGLVATFSIERLNALNYPKLIQTQLVSYSQFIEFGELYVMLQILGGWMLKYMISFYAILLIFTNLHLKQKYIKYSIFIISTIVFIGAYVASKNLFVLFILLNYYAYICLANFVIMPTVAYIIFHRKNRKTKSSAGAMQ